MGLEGYTYENASDFIGQELGVSNWLTVEQDRVNTFADCTEDHQWIHIDEERAKHTPAGGTIAHGYLTLSLVTKMTEEIGVLPKGNVIMGLNYGADKIRFINPVRVGSRIRLHSTLADVTKKDDNRYLFKISNSMEIEGESKPAMIAEVLFMVILAPA